MRLDKALTPSVVAAEIDVALAAEDPDPGVRAAAVERMCEEDSDMSREALYRALADPSPAVVRAAIDSLDIVGNESSIPQLEQIASQHPDPEVRELARESAEFLC